MLLPIFNSVPYNIDSYWPVVWMLTSDPVQVLIEVTDGGTPGMSAQSQFYITITDVDDNLPEFSVRIKRVEIK